MLVRLTVRILWSQVVDLVEDLRDGTVLCALVEALQGRRLKGWSKNPTNQHHRLDNVTTALQAIEDDSIKLVNIGEITVTKVAIGHGNMLTKAHTNAPAKLLIEVIKNSYTRLLLNTLFVILLKFLLPLLHA